MIPNRVEQAIFAYPFVCPSVWTLWYRKLYATATIPTTRDPKWWLSSISDNWSTSTQKSTSRTKSSVTLISKKL